MCLSQFECDYFKVQHKYPLPSHTTDLTFYSKCTPMPPTKYYLGNILVKNVVSFYVLY